MWHSKTKEYPSDHARGGDQNTLVLSTKYCLEGYRFDEFEAKPLPV